MEEQVDAATGNELTMAPFPHTAGDEEELQGEKGEGKVFLRGNFTSHPALILLSINSPCISKLSVYCPWWYLMRDLSQSLSQP